MPLIDGKYEIISERPLDPEQTIFEATAPDGGAVHIVWYELDAGREAHFEQYRRILKRLKRKERAAVRDVVSRPGAHYVVWTPPGDARPAPADEELEVELANSGYRAADADVRRNGRRPTVYGLAFAGTQLPLAEAPRDEPRPRPPERALEPPAWLLTVVATLLLGSAATLLLSAGLAARSNVEVVVVPEVREIEVNEATSLLHRLGLTIQAAPIASSEEAGTVLRSEPEPGSQLRPGRTVRLSYALPPGSVTPTEVPRVVARQYPGEAERSLGEAGLLLGSVSRIPAEQAAGLVIAQSPAAGTMTGEGREVDLLVSAGPDEQLTFLPNLVGMPVDDARYLARLAGLRPERIVDEEVPAAADSAGTVLAQSLRPNQPVELDSAVLRLVVARPRQTVPAGDGLPSLVGLSPDEAREVLPGASLEVEEISDRTLPEGIVSQSPSAGAPRSREVTLLVNVHPVPIPRPGVSARVREPEPRELTFRWFIEPGIGEQRARVYATTLEGDRTLVLAEDVRGGEIVAGSWRTTYPGPVRFNLTLNDQPYGIELLAH